MSDAEIESKKRKITPADNDEKTCKHWVYRKKRHCKMTVAYGREFCGEHEPPADTNKKDEGGARIPCPLDGKHTVYRNKLQKHLKICNARQKDDEPDYIERGINAGETTPDETEEDCSKLKLNELADEEFFEVIEKVKELHAKYVEGQIETLDVRHKLLDPELAQEHYGNEARKHLLQAAALLGILENEKQLQESTSFIEFGAGKGQLAFYLAQLLQQGACTNSQVVLVDRMSLRHKKDNKIEDKSLVHRIRADIADLRMDRLDILNKTKRYVGVSKHLCGAATDLTLRCITQSSNSANDEDSAVAASTEFVMIALCCHHRCDWRSFVGKEFFQANNLKPRQFVIITKMVSWAICGTGMSRERRKALEEQSLSPQEITDINSAQRLTLSEREQIGFMCKRVLDYARLEFLRKNGYESSLKYYVPREITLENVCLLARKVK